MKSKFYLIFSLLLFGIGSVIAQEKQFPQYNCAITPPAGWHQVTNLPPQQAFCVAFADPSKTRILMLIVDDKHKPAGEINDRFVTEFEKGVESSGAGRRVSGKFVDVSGVKAYERLGESQLKGKNTSTIMRVVPADGRFYSVQAMRYDGDASQDSEILAALGTFRFITPPSPPGGSDSAAYRAGYMVGRYAPFVLLGIGALVFGLIAVFRKGRRQAPPPLPPNVQS